MLPAQILLKCFPSSGYESDNPVQSTRDSLFLPSVLGLLGLFSSSSSLINPCNSNSSASLICLDAVFLWCPFILGSLGGASTSLGGTAGMAFTA